MYYLVDFAFENISNKARERIRERANYPDQGKYKRSLNFQTKVSKGRLAKASVSLNDPEPFQLRAKLTSLYENPNSPINNQVIPTRVIGTKENPLKGNLFPNTKTVVNKTGNSTVKNKIPFKHKLALGIGIPTAMLGTSMLINKLKRKETY